MSPQTPKTPAPRPISDQRLAKDVAKHLDRRRMRRKLLSWVLLVAALVLAALYARCGSGWGLGGKGKGEGSGAGPGSVQPLRSTTDTGPHRCELRVGASGIIADGKPATVEEAVAACKDAVETKVLVTGGAREGDWEDLKAALERAKIPFQRVESEGGGDGPGSGSGDSGGSGGSGEGGSGGP